MEHAATIVALVAYGFVAFAHLLPGVVSARLLARTREIAGAGVLAHLFALVWGAVVGATPPGFPEALSASGFGVMVAFVSVGRDRLRSLGMLLAPLALVLLGTAQVVPHAQVEALERTGPSAWLPVHLGLMFAGLGGFALSFAVGVTYLVVRRRLKHKQLDRLARLPSLEVLDRVQFRAMLFGFVFLTLGIGAGGAWAAASLDEPWTFDPKVLFTTVIWLWYGIALQVRLVLGWRGRLSALFSIIGFGGLVFSLLVLDFVIGGFHGYGG